MNECVIRTTVRVSTRESSAELSYAEGDGNTEGWVNVGGMHVSASSEAVKCLIAAAKRTRP